MNKNKNKILYIIIVILLIALGICISINIYMSRNDNINNGEKDIINIDCNDEDCEKKEKEKDNNSKDKDNNKDISSNNNDSGTGTINGGTSNNNGGSGNGIGNGIGSGSGSGSGSGIGPGSGSGSGSGSGNSDLTGQVGNFPGNGQESVGNGNPIENENFTIKDKYQIWSQDKSLKIFDVDSIAPGDSGTYEFIINNNTSTNVEYDIGFREENASNVNLMYKLKRNNEYIIGNGSDWINYNDLGTTTKVLNSRKNDTYTLEWKWVHSDHDTAAGRTKNAKYKLNILISAEDTDKVDTTTGSGFEYNPYTADNIIYYIELALLSGIVLILLIIKKRQKD